MLIELRIRGVAVPLGIDCCPRERPPLPGPLHCPHQLPFYFGSQLGDAGSFCHAVPPMSDGGIGLQYSISAGVDDGENDEDGEDSDYEFNLNPSASIRFNGGSHGLSGIDRIRFSLKPH